MTRLRRPAPIVVVAVLLGSLALVGGAALLADPRLAGARPTPEVTPDVAASHGAHDDHEHGGDPGHLPPVARNVELVGSLELSVGGRRARIADVAAFGNYAYLASFRDGGCTGGGVFVVDITDPARPRQVGFIAASPMNYVGEGVQVVDLTTATFSGQVLIHNNETCGFGSAGGSVGSGGASLWDVTDPLDPKPLALHIGDAEPRPASSSTGSPVAPSPTASPAAPVVHESHSAFGWQQGDRAYVAMVDNEERGDDPETSGMDIDVFDITDPRAPALVAETGLPKFPQALEDPAPRGNDVFVHDLVVKQIDGRFLLLASYWDGGYVVLDVTDLPGAPVYLRDTDFGPVEPFAMELGLPAGFTPEGNAHEAEFSHGNEFILGADEDFEVASADLSIASGPHSGQGSRATQGSGTPGITQNEVLEGATTYVGDACATLAPAPAASDLALIERGTCTFTVKVQNVEAAGYRAGIVFNDQQGGNGCERQVSMSASGGIPLTFVSRSVGLRLLRVAFEDPCATPVPADRIDRTTDPVRLRSRFDGWGYLHLYDARTMEALDHWAIAEALDPAYASGFGDLSIHEVATDPSRNLGYISYYGGGFRVVEFSREGIREVGAYIAEGGSDFWGVQVHRLPGSAEQLVLGSDRDRGLWIFRYTGGG